MINSIDNYLAKKQNLKNTELLLLANIAETQKRITNKLTVRLDGLIITGMTVLSILFAVLHK